ncbi:MAG: hypothetical protein Q8T04_08035, partial [Bacteroidota bacterium]|nr:hypothetical protein [Bacteroidota bacterium]
MRTITKKRILIIIILNFFLATIAFSQSGYIYADPNNTSHTRTKCIYTLKGTIYACDFWGLDTTACVVYSSEWKRSPGSTKSSTLRLKWKNVEASASSSLYLTVDYGIGFIDNGYAELSVNPFTLIMPTPSFN